MCLIAKCLVLQCLFLKVPFYMVPFNTKTKYSNKKICVVKIYLSMLCFFCLCLQRLQRSSMCWWLKMMILQKRTSFFAMPSSPPNPLTFGNSMLMMAMMRHLQTKKMMTEKSYFGTICL